MKDKTIKTLQQTFLAGHSTGLITHNHWSPHFTRVHASSKNGFVRNTIFFVCKRTIAAHDIINGNYHKMYFAEKLLPNLPPQSVIAVNTASDQSTQKGRWQEGFGKMTEYKSGPRYMIYHKKPNML
jgi:hypothetical protein